jgi:hypothetical protein
MAQERRDHVASFASRCLGLMASLIGVMTPAAPSAGSPTSAAATGVEAADRERGQLQRRYLRLGFSRNTQRK